MERNDGIRLTSPNFIASYRIPQDAYPEKYSMIVLLRGSCCKEGVVASVYCIDAGSVSQEQVLV